MWMIFYELTLFLLSYAKKFLKSIKIERKVKNDGTKSHRYEKI